VPLPKVRGVSEAEVFKVVKTGKSRRKMLLCLHLPNEHQLYFTKYISVFSLLTSVYFIMTTLWNRAGHYIFALWFLLLSIYLLSFFLA